MPFTTIPVLSFTTVAWSVSTPTPPAAMTLVVPVVLNGEVAKAEAAGGCGEEEIGLIRDREVLRAERSVPPLFDRKRALHHVLQLRLVA